MREASTGLVAYLVLDTKGAPIGLVAEANDGSTVRAWMSNPLGGFRHWLVHLPGGPEVQAEASGTVLDGFTQSSH
jgi:hypothetical protein